MTLSTECHRYFMRTHENVSAATREGTLPARTNTKNRPTTGAHGAGRDQEEAVWVQRREGSAPPHSDTLALRQAFSDSHLEKRLQLLLPHLSPLPDHSRSKLLLRRGRRVDACAERFQSGQMSLKSRPLTSSSDQ
ncbi:uncharacterized protein LOC125045509 [Penaeus chinensis]|uniref:uncharacterized protein LOC125045509 n=1 Tax=Penaeus chinensis TaxID=139456 RepID=UPI001FB7223E|nr:uncharacterized protein LOC125045509 [Penaeus chinensis]